MNQGDTTPYVNESSFARWVPSSSGDSWNQYSSGIFDRIRHLNDLPRHRLGIIVELPDLRPLVRGSPSSSG